MHNQAGYCKCDERDKPRVQQLPPYQRATSFAQHLAGVDALDAERNLRKSEIDEVDNGNENQQNGNERQGNGDSPVGTGIVRPHVTFKVGLVKLADSEAFTQLCQFVGTIVGEILLKNGEHCIYCLCGGGGVFQFYKCRVGPLTPLGQIPVAQVPY